MGPPPVMQPPPAVAPVAPGAPAAATGAAGLEGMSEQQRMMLMQVLKLPQSQVDAMADTERNAILQLVSPQVSHPSADADAF